MSKAVFIISLIISVVVAILAVKARGYLAVGGEVFLPIAVIAGYIYTRTKSTNKR